MNRPIIYAARNLIAGLLIGYGVVSFLCFLGLQALWARAAPRQPNAALGLTCVHSVHGSYIYFSAFQATAGALLVSTSVLSLLGILLAPKKDGTGAVRLHGAKSPWNQDDPRRLMKWAMLASAAVTPLFLFFVGPSIVRALNAVGFVINLG